MLYTKTVASYGKVAVKKAPTFVAADILLQWFPFVLKAGLIEK